MEYQLRTYFRSSCSWRVRIALHYKGLSYTPEYVHLLQDGGQQHGPEHLRTNPMAQIPVLRVGEEWVAQSVGILEYLEEAHPAPPLLPAKPLERAKVRELVQHVNSGIQPLQNLRVIQEIQKRWEFPREEAIRWCHDWIRIGLEAMEQTISGEAGAFSVGDNLTMADCCLIPQLYNARRFGIDTTEFPTLNRVDLHCATLRPFQAAHPDAQGDCPTPA